MFHSQYMHLYLWHKRTLGMRGCQSSSGSKFASADQSTVGIQRRGVLPPINICARVAYTIHDESRVRRVSVWWRGTSELISYQVHRSPQAYNKYTYTLSLTHSLAHLINQPQSQPLSPEASERVTLAIAHAQDEVTGPLGSCPIMASKSG